MRSAAFRIIAVIAALLGLTVSPTVGYAAKPTSALTFSGGQNDGIFGYSVGWEFTVNTPIDVISLGWFDASTAQNPLNESHAVGIFAKTSETTGSLLVSTMVDPTDPLTPQTGPRNGFRYHALDTPTHLGLGTYVIAGENTTSSATGFYNNVTSVSTIPQITYVKGRFEASGGTLVFPDRDSDRLTAYFGPSFQVAAIPEPETYAMMLAGLGLMGFMARRKELQAA